MSHKKSNLPELTLLWHITNWFSAHRVLHFFLFKFFCHNQQFFCLPQFYCKRYATKTAAAGYLKKNFESHYTSRVHFRNILWRIYKNFSNILYKFWIKVGKFLSKFFEKLEENFEWFGKISKNLGVVVGKKILKIGHLTCKMARVSREVNQDSWGTSFRAANRNKKVAYVLLPFRI